MNFSKNFVHFTMYSFTLSGLAMLWLSIMGIKEMRAAELAIWVCYGLASLAMAGVVRSNDSQRDMAERTKLAKEAAQEALKMYDIRRMQDAKNSADTSRIIGGEA